MTVVPDSVYARVPRDDDERLRIPTLGEWRVHEGQMGPEQALSELRRRLQDGLAGTRLSKTQLAAKASMARTTAYEALRAGGPVPSAQTVAALARTLKLPTEELLELRRRADASAGPHADMAAGPGRPLSGWDPHDLEVHPAGVAPESGGVRERRVLPGYVVRDHDEVLADAVREATAGRSRMVMLVGSSSTGKTRACWQAVQPLADLGWRLWHPFNPARADAALADLHRVGPRTVVWLNEAQHYFDDPARGERIAAALHHVLTTRDRAPVLVLGTLWNEYADRYTALPSPGWPDSHSRTRELLSARCVLVPDAFDAPSLAEAWALAAGGDALLVDALTRAGGDGRLAQDLAGAPELLRRYEGGSPPVRALLEAAMDARRLGVGLPLAQAFLTDAAPDYLAEIDGQQLAEDWAEAAYAELARPVHGKQAPLSRIHQRHTHRPPGTALPRRISAGPVFRLADYLEQHGRAARRGLCPPASFWHAAYTRLGDADDLYHLAEAARHMHRSQWAHHLLRQAADIGSVRAMTHVAGIREHAGDQEEAEALFWRAADAGSRDALLRLAELRKQAGDREGEEGLLRRAVDAGDCAALLRLAELRERAGDQDEAEALAQRATDAGDTHALTRLADIREQTGNQEGAEAMLRKAVDAGDTHALNRATRLRERAGDRDEAEALAQRATDAGDTHALTQLAELRKQTGDQEGALTLARRAADAGDTLALALLAAVREQAGDRDGAETLAQRAADAGDTHALTQLANIREHSGDLDGNEAMLRRAADAGSVDALLRLAYSRERAGDREGTETLLREAADASIYAVNALISFLDRAGDREEAQALARQAADASHDSGFYQLNLLTIWVLDEFWPYGLDPDGTPTAPWS